MTTRQEVEAARQELMRVSAALTAAGFTPERDRLMPRVEAARLEFLKKREEFNRA